MARFILVLRCNLQESGKFVEGCLTCKELVGEVNHTTECVTDLFSFWDFLFTTESFEFYDYSYL